jgi:Ala-tRNA(Pro) deacylase
MSNVTTTFTSTLDAGAVSYELLEHERTDRAADEAAALGVGTEEVAKTIVVTAGDTNVRVVLPASERLDMHKLRALLATGKALHLLTEDDLARDYPEFELGAVPPLGGRTDEVIVDRRIAELDRIAIEAGSHSHSVRIAPADLVSAAQARVADVCAD